MAIGPDDLASLWDKNLFEAQRLLIADIDEALASEYTPDTQTYNLRIALRIGQSRYLNQYALKAVERLYLAAGWSYVDIDSEDPLNARYLSVVISTEESPE